MHCGDQRHLGMCLGYVPALAYYSCRVADQDTNVRASDLHNARWINLNPSNSIFFNQQAIFNSFWLYVKVLLYIVKTDLLINIQNKGTERQITLIRIKRNPISEKAISYVEYNFLHERPWESPWVDLIYLVFDITFPTPAQPLLDHITYHWYSTRQISANSTSQYEDK